jgi:hypothetical protein
VPGWERSTWLFFARTYFPDYWPKHDGEISSKGSVPYASMVSGAVEIYGEIKYTKGDTIMRNGKWILSRLIGIFLGIEMVIFFPLSIIAGIDTTEGFYDGDPLWQKAMELVSANRNLVPGNLESRTEEMDSKGKLLNLHESWIRFSRGNDGQIKAEIIKALKNGEDITESQKQLSAEQDKDSNKKDSFNLNLWEDYPFKANYQPAIKSLSNSELIQEKSCQVYEYSFRKPNKTTYRGTAWLETETGIPVKLSYTCAPLPQFVSRLETTVIFDSPQEGVLYPVEIQTDGAGSFLLIKRNFRTIMKCSDFWKQLSEVK